MIQKVLIYSAVLFGISFTSCRKEGCTDAAAVNYDPSAKKEDGSCVYKDPTNPNDTTGNDTSTYNPTPQPLAVPSLFSQFLLPPNIPQDNPQTVEGIALGKKLFYDPILSGNGTLACAGCHMPASSFGDSVSFSKGIDGIKGTRNAMVVINMAWNNDGFFWDGRAPQLEDQALAPVVNPVEMHTTWPNAVAKLQASTEYPPLFKKAFGTSTIDSMLVVKAIAQFERTMISGNSKFDKYLRQETTLNSQELAGYNLFMTEKADCFHCHGSPQNPLWTDNKYHNNGLDSVFTNDIGREKVTGNPADQGKFRTPTLRNLVFTAPYMHDGRFNTIDEVIDHYNSGMVNSPTLNSLLAGHLSQGGLQLTTQDKQALKAFLLTLTDSSYVTNPDFLP